jgi:hypothetical protein
VAKERRTIRLDRAESALRRDSPAYRSGDDWEVLAPQAMDVVISVRFDAGTARRLAERGGQSRRTVSRLIRDWTIERLDLEADAEGQKARIGEASLPYVTDADYETLRLKYRPRDIRMLLVGESRPAGGTFFYLANSNLFFATREAFIAAHGSMPPGEEFLSYLSEHGVWLVDVAQKPVNRLPGRPRKAAVGKRVTDLAETLRDANPDIVVAIKRDLASSVRDAMTRAGIDLDRLAVLPFPLYQWRREYVRGLARFARQLDSPQSIPAMKDQP